MRAHGLDISHHQNCFHPENAAGRVEHVTLRLSYGMDIDTRWSAYQDGTSQVPLRGAYQYLRSGQPWREQADLALSMLQDTALPYHWLAVDAERYGNTLDARFAQSAWEWLHYVSERFAGRVLLYTSPDVFDTCLGYYIQDWEIFELWLAQYWWNPDPERKNPRLPRR